MLVEYDKSLKPYNTFGIDARAQRMVTVCSESDVVELVSSHWLEEEPFFVLGGGSNVVFVDDYRGTVVRMTNKGIKMVHDEGDDVLIEASAGEVWNDFVWYCVNHGWYGVENLVAIPGTVGASAVQNVGAYGMEAKDAIEYVVAYDVATGERTVITNQECHFGYRHSVFKAEKKDCFVITSVVYRLHKHFKANKDYKTLLSALDEEGLVQPTAQQMASVITKIRNEKLPNPSEIGSAGSFFQNPVVTASAYEDLLERYPKLVAFPLEDGRYKLAAGWLIEQSGWKGRGIGRAGVYAKQALVLINQGGCSGKEVVTLANAIIADVEDKFGVVLHPEAIMVGL